MARGAGHHRYTTAENGFAITQLDCDSTQKFSGAIDIFANSIKLRIMQLNIKLRQARKRAKLTQRQVAGLAGITVVYLSYLENGHSEPSLRVLKKLAKVLKTCPAELVK
jgi:DNA-binding XRE family transcriptional regulator